MRIGPYEIIGELGRGGMGIVYRARRVDLDREFALKVVPPSALGSPQAVARLRREAQAAARLASVEGIVGVHDVGEDDGQVYIAMDLVDGHALDHLIDEGELTPWQSAEIVVAAARAVHAAHELGVLHRDIKPGNILVDRASVTFVADFGLAQVAEADLAVTKLTKSGEILGTPSYMPPEQVRGESLDCRADVYTLGATLYEALGGRPPFQGDSIHGVLNRVLHEEPPSLRTLDGRIPSQLEAVVHRALAKRPADRYESAEALADDLERFLSGSSVVAKMPSSWERFRRWARQHRPAMVVMAVSAVGFGATIGVMINTQRDQAVIEETAEALSTTELAGRLSGAYFELARSTAGAMGRLEDHWQGVPVAPEDVQTARAEVRAAVDVVRAKYPGTRVADGWLIVAEHYADQPIALNPTLHTIAQLESMGTNDPFPRMLAARLALGVMTVHVQLGSIHLGSEGVRVPEYLEAPRLKQLRERAMALVGSVMHHPVWPLLDHGANYLDFAQAAVAFVDRDYERCAALLTPLTDDPLLERGAVPLLGIALFFGGRFDEASQAWERPVMTRWAAASRNAAVARMGSAEFARHRGEDPGPHYERVTRHVERALPGLKAHRFARSIRAHALYRWAEYKLNRGEAGVAPLLDASIADYAEVLKLEPGERGALNGVGLVHALHADLAAREGRPSIPHFTRAVAAYERSAAAGDPVAYCNLAKTLKDLAGAEHASGKEPLETLQRALRTATTVVEMDVDYPEAPSIRGQVGAALSARLAQLGRRAEAEQTLVQAIADHQATLKRLPRHTDGILTLSEALRQLAALRASDGGDFAPDMQSSEDVLESMLAEFPNHAEARFSRGQTRREWANLRAARGIPIGNLVAGALEDLTHALTVNPGHRSARTTRGTLYKEIAKRQRDAGADPRPTYRLALNDFDELIRLHPGYDGGWVNRGSVHADLGEAAVLRGEDPTLHEQAAMNDYTRTLKINANNFAATYNIAYRSGQRGQRLLAAGKDPRVDCRRAVTYYTRAIALRPNYADAYLNLSSIWGRIAQTERALKLPLQASIDGQLDVLGRAIARFPKDLRFYTNRADALRQLGDDLVAAGEDGSDRFRAALSDTDFLLEQPKVLWQTHTIRGIIFERLGRLEEAVVSHETAVKVSGGQQTPKNYLKIAKSKLGR